jgi:proline iminopeptidase
MNSSVRLPLFPELQPFNRGRLRVSALHEIYFEECGNPAGDPVVVLHGGPGGGISPFLRRLHDPRHYHIVLLDQRGCGASTPRACLEENTTWHLVSDLEILRERLGIEHWHVFGGSWGSTLALAYALKHPAQVKSLVLRGIFTLRETEIRCFYQQGADALFPDAFEKFKEPIPESERHDLVRAHHRRLTGTNEAERLASARAWSQWEGSTLSLLPNPARVESFGSDEFALTFASIECHYFVNHGFFEHDGWIIAQAHKLKRIPGVIVQGRYDVVTPMITAYDLHRAWPEAEFVIVDDAGHTALESGLTDALIRATNRFASAKSTV